MTTKECSSCKTSNPVSANFCRKCGHRFPEHTKPGKSQMCHIENFSIKKQSNGKFLVEWDAINADRVTLNGIDVTGGNKFIATVKGSQTISLRAENATSYDEKEANVVYDSQTVYKDKIVEKKVVSATNVTAIIFLILFMAISASSLYYAYQLEDYNYNGDRYLSDVFGYKPYLMVNGSNADRTVEVPAQGASLMYDINTNASEYEVLDLPNWCTLEKSGSHFIIKAIKNRQSERTANIRVKTKAEGMEVKINLTQAAEKITGEIKDITVEYDVFKDGVKGMKILVDFSVENMKGIDGYCAVYFYYENGNKVMDKNQKYTATDGHAATHTTIKPGYHPITVYTDLEIFMPYNELEVGSGKHNLKFCCILWENSSSSANSIAQSQYYSFTLTNN